MNGLTLILGGARSGKSSYALALAQAYEQVLFVATAQPFDDEMALRIERHQAERPSHWHTLEAPTHVGRAIRQCPRPYDLIVIDCLTLLTSNVLLALGEEVEADVAETAVMAELESLLTTQHQTGKEMIIVSNEVGLGSVPVSSLGRVYRDVLGRANQQLAARADTVLFMVAGRPLSVKVP